MPFRIPVQGVGPLFDAELQARKVGHIDCSLLDMLARDPELCSSARYWGVLEEPSLDSALGRPVVRVDICKWRLVMQVWLPREGLMAQEARMELLALECDPVKPLKQGGLRDIRIRSREKNCAVSQLEGHLVADPGYFRAADGNRPARRVCSSSGPKV